jgi:hypothetical protein
MRKKITAYFLLFCLITLPLIGWSFIDQKVSYQLKIQNLNPKVTPYILYPKTIDFLPLSLPELQAHFAQSQYNFIYYIQCDYFHVDHDTLYLKLA